MGEKLPVRIYLPEEIVEELKQDAENLRHAMSYNEIAAEIVIKCRPIWLLARQAFDQTVDDWEDNFRQVAEIAKSQRKPR